jgi:hypothetical protein
VTYWIRKTRCQTHTPEDHGTWVWYRPDQVSPPPPPPPPPAPPPDPNKTKLLALQLQHVIGCFVARPCFEGTRFTGQWRCAGFKYQYDIPKEWKIFETENAAVAWCEQQLREFHGHDWWNNKNITRWYWYDYG